MYREAEAYVLQISILHIPTRLKHEVRNVENSLLMNES